MQRNTNHNDLNINNRNKTLDNLSLEILLLILVQLDPISLIYLRVNRYFHSTITTELDHLWRAHFFYQFGLMLEPKLQFEKKLPSIFLNHYRLYNIHLSKKEKECFTLVCANDLYLIKQREIQFSNKLLTTRDAQNRTLLSLIRQQKNPTLNKYVFENIYQNSTDVFKEILLIETAIKLDQCNDLLLEHLNNKNIDAGSLPSNHLSILCFSVTHRALSVVKKLLSLGANPNYANPETSPPLHIAAEMGFIEIVHELLAHKDIEVDSLYENKYTPLYRAATAGHDAVVLALLQKGAHVDGKVVGCYPLFSAVEEGHIEIIKLLLAHGAKVNIRAKSKPLIHVAAQNNQLKALQVLVEYYQKKGIHPDFEARADDTTTALYIAALNGLAPICQFLIDQGARVDGDFPETTPIFIAVKHAHYEVFNLLCKAKSPKTYLPFDTLFLLIAYACNNEFSPIVNYLLNPSILELNDLVKNCFLHRACARKSLSLVKTLISLGVPVDSKNQENETALQLAAVMGQKEIVDFLLACGANPNLCFKDGCSIIQAVCARVPRYITCLSIIRALLHAGADLSTLYPQMKILNSRVAYILLPTLEKIPRKMNDLVHITSFSAKQYTLLLESLTQFITNEEKIYHSCKDARVCLNLLKNVSTSFGYVVVLYALLAKSNKTTHRFSFNSNSPNQFVQCVINNLNFQSSFTAQQSFYVTIFASLGCNKGLLQVLKELVIEPIMLDAVNMSNDTFQAVLLSLNFFEAKIKHAPKPKATIDETRNNIERRM